MVELGYVNLLRTILIIVLVYYVSRFLLRWWIKRKLADMHKRQQNSVSEEEANFKRNDKGKVHIKQKKSSGQESSGGEYVDFEEVD
ncbi:MAG: hypothetical protein CMP63_01345 [Flavobacteriales bacterium]|nr:hypothetical protein [Flavobacteriales bacterium]|tara:strand:+ start:1186 stop:1443 length:258 start_codon:yes stop_codon:yes gene_type:complete